MTMEEMKNVDVTKVDPRDLVDVRDVKINGDLKPEKRKEDFIAQIKNPYCYKYAGYIVKITFEDTDVTLAERLREMISRTCGTI